jgi:hypothetical protein
MKADVDAGESQASVYYRMTGKQSVSEALGEAGCEAESEVQRAMEYIETNIVPKPEGKEKRSCAAYRRS